MLGVLVLREIGVLLVAIMVAGRSAAPTPRTRLDEDARGDRRPAHHGFDPIEVLILPGCWR